MEIGIHFGALADTLSEQLKEYPINENDLEHFQKDADAITRLSIRQLIPDSLARTSRKKLLKNIIKSIEKQGT